jgi:hypothetical protein
MAAVTVVVSGCIWVVLGAYVCRKSKLVWRVGRGGDDEDEDGRGASASAG